MQTESQTPPEAEAGPSARSPSNENGAAPAPAPAPAKKPTRQWDAWTRQEEENFFIALRQVGKNFEKITSRVQSKNKDQVRHYYYRLIKRMNKLLGPGFALDAKNSKDANAAMLRWWSLLEKHSCSASKLHLKPRRFKTFVTALGHQLLKDRKKTKRKQPSQDATATSASYVTATAPSRTVVNDPESAKVLSIEAQNVQKSGSGRGAAVKRNGGAHTSRGKGEPSNTKPPRQRRRAADGLVSLAAYKRWEKAASAGVTLVAEAAEQLERAAISEQFPSEHGDLHCPSPHQSPLSVSVGVGLAKRKNGQSQANVMKPISQSSSMDPMKLAAEGRGWDAAVLSTSLRFQNTALQAVGTTNSHQVTGQGAKVPSLQPGQMFEPLFKNSAECSTSGIAGKPESMVVKLKLQLYPIDEFTRKALEKDGHNPHLELTLKARKMISSVLQHLMQKWGRSSVASGELMLFPYNAQWKDLPNCQSWTLKDTTASAGDVHAAVGSPAIFRLRYGWFSSRVFQIPNAEHCQQPASCSSRIEMPESCLQCESERTVKLRRLDIGRSSAMPPLTNQDDTSKRICTEFAPCNGNSSNSMKTEMSCSHLATRALCVYQDSARSITLPLETVQSTTHMSTVMSVKAPAVPPNQSASLSQEMKGTVEEVGIDYSNRFLSKHVKMVEDECRDIDQEQGSSLRPISSARTQQTLESSVPEKACRGPEFPSQIPGSSWLNEESNDGFAQRLWEDEETLKSNNGILLSTMDWVDSLTNISVGDLLNEASCAEHGSPFECLSINTGIRSQQILHSLDSFDAAIAAHVSRSQVGANMSVHHSETSIWDGEETCDAFAFQKIPQSVQDLDGSIKAAVQQPHCQQVPTNSTGLSVSLERFVNGISTSEGGQEVPRVDLQAKHESQDGTGIRQFTPNELYWADSLGSLDMGIRPYGGQSQDLMVGDISISLSGLIASSLDAFQNCSFLGSDKKISTTVNNQDQQSLSLFCIKEIGSIYPSVTSSENMGMGRQTSSEAMAEFGAEPGDSNVGVKQDINSEYGGSFSSQSVEASAASVSNQKGMQEKIVPGGSDSFNLHNACLRADSEAKVLPLVGASV